MKPARKGFGIAFNIVYGIWFAFTFGLKLWTGNIDTAMWVLIAGMWFGFYLLEQNLVQKLFKLLDHDHKLIDSMLNEVRKVQVRKMPDGSVPSPFYRKL